MRPHPRGSGAGHFRRGGDGDVAAKSDDVVEIQLLGQHPVDGVDGPNGIGVPQYGSCEPVEREPPARSITTIGPDTAKSVFQVHGVNVTGKVEIMT
jgi:hypothetical protein